MRAGTIVGLTALALLAGIGAGEMMYRSKICRDAIGRCFARGRLMALVNGRGIYESDVNAELAAVRYLAGNSVMANSEETVLRRLIADEELRCASHSEAATSPSGISEKEMQSQFDLLRHEFADDKLWLARMANSGISAESLRRLLRENLLGRRLIEQEIAKELDIKEDSLRGYYAQHPAEFAQPLRIRASHIFLAAPPGTSPEIVEAKKKLIDSLAARLRDGEDFGALGWEESEDEASKPREGDLGYISSWRIPQDFFAAVSQLKVGETSKPIRTTLGFHIVRVTEIKPARQMTFEEARFEIAARLTNQRRQQGVAAVAARLDRSSALRSGWFWN